MPQKNGILLGINELAKLHTLTPSQFREKKKAILSKVKPSPNTAMITKRLVDYCQSDQNILSNLEHAQTTRFIEIIVAICERAPAIFTRDLIEALGQKATKYIAKLIYNQVEIQKSTQSKPSKKINLKKMQNARSILRQLHIEGLTLTSQKQIPKKKTPSRTAVIQIDLNDEPDLNNLKSHSSPAFSLSTNENRDINIVEHKKKYRSASEKSLPIEYENDALDFSKKTDWNSLNNYTKRALNTIEHHIQYQHEQNAIQIPASTPKPLVLNDEIEFLKMIFPLEEAALSPFEHDISDFFNQEEELQTAMFSKLDIDTLEEAKSESLIKKKCEQKLRLLNDKWKYLTRDDILDKKNKIAFFSKETAKIQQQLEQKIGKIATLKQEAKNKYDLEIAEWSNYQARHFIDVPLFYTEQQNDAYEKALAVFDSFMIIANKRELVLQNQLVKVTTTMASLAQEEKLAVTTYTALQSIYQAKIDSFAPNITFIQNTQQELEQINKALAELPEPLEQLVALREKTEDDLRAALAAVASAEISFNDIKDSKHLLEKRAAYEADFEKFQAMEAPLKKNGQQLLTYMAELKNLALEYNHALEEAQNPACDSSVIKSIHQLKLEISTVELLDDDKQIRTLEGATSGGLETLRSKAQYLLKNAQTLQKTLAIQLPDLYLESNQRLSEGLRRYNEQRTAFLVQHKIVHAYFEDFIEKEQSERTQKANEHQIQIKISSDELRKSAESKRNEEKQAKLDSILALQQSLLAKSLVHSKQDIFDPLVEEKNSFNIDSNESPDKQFLYALPALNENLKENIAILKLALSDLQIEQQNTELEIAKIRHYAPRVVNNNRQLDSIITSNQNQLEDLKQLQDSVVAHFYTIKEAIKAKSLLIEKEHAIYSEIKKLSGLDINSDDSELDQRLNLLTEKNNEVDSLIEQSNHFIKTVEEDINIFLTNGYIEPYVNSLNNIEENDPVGTIIEVQKNISQKINALVIITINEIRNNQLTIVRLKTRNLSSHKTYLSNLILNIQIARLDEPSPIDNQSPAELARYTEITKITDSFKQQLIDTLEKVRSSDYLSDKDKADYFQDVKKIKDTLLTHATSHKPKTTLEENQQNWETACNDSDGELSNLYNELQSSNPPISLERVEQIQEAFSNNKSSFTQINKHREDIQESTLTDAESALCEAKLKLEKKAKTIDNKINENKTAYNFTKNKLRELLWGLFRLAPVAAGAVAGAVIGFSIASLPGVVVGGIVGGVSAVIGETLFGSIARRLASTEAKRAAKTRYETRLDTGFAEFKLITNLAQRVPPALNQPANRNSRLANNNLPPPRFRDLLTDQSPQREPALAKSPRPLPSSSSIIIEETPDKKENKGQHGDFLSSNPHQSNKHYKASKYQSAKEQQIADLQTMTDIDIDDCRDTQPRVL
ncbi:MAG: hypothetical protein HKM04_05130 [Legionellales bacterium]|nr:hypothetical protein [Legionellales bacterium]